MNDNPKCFLQPSPQKSDTGLENTCISVAKKVTEDKQDLQNSRVVAKEKLSRLIYLSSQLFT